MQTNPLFPNMWPASTGSQTGVPACCPSWCPTCVQQCGLTRPDALPLHVQVARQHLQPDVGPCLLTNMAPHMRGVPAPRSATGEEARQAFLRARGCWPPADTQVQRLTGDPFALFLLLAFRLLLSQAGDAATPGPDGLYAVTPGAKEARDLFAVSILYLFALFAALLVEHLR